MSSSLSSLLLNASVSLSGWSDADAIREALQQAQDAYEAKDLAATRQHLELALQLVDRKQGDLLHLEREG